MDKSIFCRIGLTACFFFSAGLAILKGADISEPSKQPKGYTIPMVDLAQETARQVIVDKEAGQYLGHPTTVLLEDNKTMICVYPKGHGRGAIVMKRSADAGLTWSERLKTPENWATSLEVPTIHRVIDPQGKKRLIMFSGLYPIRMAVSEDDGIIWTPLKPIGDFGGIVTMSCVTDLKTGKGHYLAMFHDDGRFFTKEGKRTGTFTVYKTFSMDGGLTWSFPEEVWNGSEIHLCEPGIIRSPDGRQLAVLLRENARRRNSHVIFSNDEGKTWTEPRELPGSLTGDRHTGRYAPDGRLFISFRDTTLESPTAGDWVGWVGTYDDIVKNREGQYRVRLMDNTKGGDCAYPAVEVLPDGTFVTTTYGHWVKDEQSFIVSVRFKMQELDAKYAALSVQHTVVFREGVENDGYPRIRIPSIVTTKKGTLLAFAEGRKGGDHSENDIILKRSTDGGKTWGPLQVVAEDGKNCLGNPIAVVENNTGRVIVMYQRYPLGYHEQQVVPGYEDPHVCRSFVLYSDDDGLNFSAPKEITRSVKRPTEVTSIASGPGVGIQIRRGKYKDRIIFPFNQGPYDKWKVYAVFSDDIGKTWNYGDVAPDGDTGIGNEVQMVELSDGAVMLNARSGSGTQLRKTAISKDGGSTWTAIADDPSLQEPQCMGSILRYSDPLDGKKSRIIFANPASTKERVNGIIRLSYDEGKTWPVAKTIYDGPYAYSCLAVLQDGDIGCLYEKDNYQTITFARLSLEWLTDGKDSLKE